MKSKQTSGVIDMTLTATVLPIVALLAILSGVFISDGPVLAQQQSAEETRISADLNESYFSETEKPARLAQLIEPRSSDEAATGQTDTETDTADDGDSSSDSDVTESTDTNQCSQVYLSDNLRIDFNNDSTEVLKLQSFLKTYEDFDYVSLSGTFDAATLRAVKAFQTRYAEDVLAPWGYEADEATGYVYITTKQKINEIYCDEQFLLSRSQQTEIREYRQRLNTWRAQGASFDTPQYLAEYYNQSTYTYTATADQTQPEENERNTLEPRDSSSSSGVTVTETASTDTATSATTSERHGGLIARLFGGSSDTDATSTATTTDAESADDEQADAEDGETDTETDDTATSATTTRATTSSFDQLAAGIYTGVNGVINFLLSPTFLLIVLVILILLLIGTLIDTDELGSSVEDEAADDTDDDPIVEESNPEAEYEETRGWADEEVIDLDEDVDAEADTDN